MPKFDWINHFGKMKFGIWHLILNFYLLRLRETHNALQLPVFFFFLLLLVFLPALSGISRNSEQKAILETTKELIQYTVLEIHFRSLKYTTVIRIRKHLSNFPFRPKRYNKARTVCWCKKPTSNNIQILYVITQIVR